MRVRLICVGDKMPAWVSQGYYDYAKRLQKFCDFELKEIALHKRGKNNLTQLLKKESDGILQLLSPQEHVIALDVLGKQLDTLKMSRQLNAIQELSKPVSFIIGGPEGIQENVLNRANEKWSLSMLTLPHPLARVVLVEQLYRCWSILNNHPYHRA